MYFIAFWFTLLPGEVLMHRLAKPDDNNISYGTDWQMVQRVKAAIYLSLSLESTHIVKK
jgi:hypothetical protein